MTGRTHQGIGESVTGIVDVSDELIFREISRPMSPETLQQNGAAKRIKREKPLRGVVRKPWTPAEVLFSKALAHFGPKDVETNPITGRVSIHLGSVSSNAKKSRFERSNIELNVAKGVLSPLHHVRRRVIDL